MMMMMMIVKHRLVTDTHTQRQIRKLDSLGYPTVFFV